MKAHDWMLEVVLDLQHYAELNHLEKCSVALSDLCEIVKSEVTDVSPQCAAVVQRPTYRAPLYVIASRD